MEPKCPYMIAKGSHLSDEYYVFCDLNGMMCLVECGNNCNVYDDWLKEADDD